MKKRPLRIPDHASSTSHKELFLAVTLSLLALLFYLEFHLFRFFSLPVSSNDVSLAGASYFCETSGILNIPFSWLAFFMAFAVIYLVLRLKCSKIQIIYTRRAVLRSILLHLAAL